MFCRKCGKPNDDDAQFCEFCGAEFKRRAANPETQPVTQTAVQPANQQKTPKKRVRKLTRKRLIINFVITAVLFGVCGVFLLNLNTPSLSGYPKMAVNGKNVYADLACVSKYNDVFIGGKVDDRIFVIVISGSLLSGKSNTTINEFNYGDLAIYYSEKDLPPNNGYYPLNSVNPTSDIKVKVGKRNMEDGWVEILVSGKSELFGNTYNIKAGGKIDYRRGFSGLDEWYTNNRIPA